MSEKSEDVRVERVIDDGGNVIEECHYKNGVLNGVRTLWSPNGVKIGESEYVDGKLHGRCLLWNEEGQKTLDTNYRTGELHGYYTSWWGGGGNKKEDGIYENGKRVGKYYWYLEDGDILLEHYY